MHFDDAATHLSQQNLFPIRMQHANRVSSLGRLFVYLLFYVFPFRLICNKTDHIHHTFQTPYHTLLRICAT